MYALQCAVLFVRKCQPDTLKTALLSEKSYLLSYSNILYMVHKLQKQMPKLLFNAFEVFIWNLSYLQQISRFTTLVHFWSCSQRLTH